MRNLTKIQKIILSLVILFLVVSFIVTAVSVIKPYLAAPFANQPLMPFMKVSWYVGPNEVIATTGQPASSYERHFKTYWLIYPGQDFLGRTAEVSYNFEYNHLYKCTWVFTNPLSEQAALIQDIEAVLTEYGLSPVQVTNPTQNFIYYGDADTLAYLIKGPIINFDEIICIKVVLICRHSKTGAIYASALK